MFVHGVHCTNFLFILSEGYTQYFQPGSYLFSHPAAVEHWNQSVPASLPTPPDTVSEYSSASDCQDMGSQPWSQTTSLPDAWTTTDNSTLVQTAADDWQAHSTSVTTQDIAALNTAAWLSVTQGPVDQGLSPVLSNISQSTHTRNSISESDVSLLPPRLDLSFATEPEWNGPLAYATPDTSVHTSPAFGFSSYHDQSAFSMDCPSTAPQGMFPGAEPLYHPQGAQVSYPQRSVSFQQVHPVQPKRMLLPRTEGSNISTLSTVGPYASARPHIQSSRNSQRSLASVSTHGHFHDGLQNGSATRQDSRYVAISRAEPVSPNGVPALPQAIAPVPAPAVSVASMPYSMDPTAEDFREYIDFHDHEDPSTLSAALRLDSTLPYADDRETNHCCCSYSDGYGVTSAIPSSAPGDVKPVLSKPEQNIKPNYQVSTGGAQAQSTDVDEGRHRNHPYYFKPPQADGYYHCPYETDEPTCPHKPTKLKCNYEYD